MLSALGISPFPAKVFGMEKCLNSDNSVWNRPNDIKPSVRKKIEADTWETLLQVNSRRLYAIRNLHCRHLQ